MAIYYGVVHDNRIEIEGGARLAEGTRVEVRPRSPSDVAVDDEEIKEQLRAAGLLAPAPVAATGDEAFAPVLMQGEPLSEPIIRERR